MSAPLALLRKRIVRQYGGHVKPWERKSCINGCVQGHSGCPLSDRSVVTGSTAVCRLASFFTYGSLIASQWCPQGTRFPPVPFGANLCLFSSTIQRSRLCGGDQRALRSPFGNLRGLRSSLGHGAPSRSTGRYSGRDSGMETGYAGFHRCHGAVRSGPSFEGAPRPPSNNLQAER